LENEEILNKFAARMKARSRKKHFPFARCRFFPWPCVWTEQKIEFGQLEMCFVCTPPFLSLCWANFAARF
jgi:hypothetical protein